MSLTSFNKELLSDRLNEYQSNLQRALEQHQLLSTKLHSVKVRFHRAVNQGKKTFSYKYSMQMSCISGTMCMYEDYMRRKAEQIRKLRTFQRHIDRSIQCSSSTTNSELADTSDNSGQSFPTDSHNDETVTQSFTRQPDSDEKTSPDKCGESCLLSFPKVSRKRRYDETSSLVQDSNNHAHCTLSATDKVSQQKTDIRPNT